MPIVTLIGSKGGTAKTALTLSLGTELAQRASWRVALVDHDPQGSTTRMLPANAEQNIPHELVEDALSAPPVPVDIGQARLNGGDLVLYRGSELVLNAPRSAVVEAVRRAGQAHDITIVDTVPMIFGLTLGAAEAADLVIIPMSPTASDYDAIHRVIAMLKVNVQPTPRIRIVFTRVLANRSITREMAARIDDAYPGLRYESMIPFRDSAQRSADYLRPDVIWDKIIGDGALAAAYKALATEVESDLRSLGLRDRFPTASATDAREVAHA